MTYEGLVCRPEQVPRSEAWVGPTEAAFQVVVGGRYRRACIPALGVTLHVARPAVSRSAGSFGRPPTRILVNRLARYPEACGGGRLASAGVGDRLHHERFGERAASCRVAHSESRQRPAAVGERDHRSTAGIDEESFDGGRELPDVARPGIALHRRTDRVIEFRRAVRVAAPWCADGADVANETDDVGGALAEWRNANGERADAVAEVGEEAAFIDECVESLVGGEDESDVRTDGTVAADRVEVAVFLDDAKQLPLDDGGGFADLIEEQGAAGGGDERASTRGVGASERTFRVAEEIGAHERVVSCSERDCAERLRPPR